MTLVAVSFLLVWMVDKLTSSHREYHQAVADESSRSTAEQVSRFIVERERLVSLFAQKYIDTLLKVINDPEDDDLRDSLAKQIGDFFPDHFAFTIADKNGIPYFEDFDGLVSEMCEVDLKQFSKQGYYGQVIHPNSEVYHFDVMANFGNEDVDAILFISFNSNLLGNILSTAQTKGHQMMLLFSEKEDLIEVIASGARNVLSRDDYRLSLNEKNRILQRVKVKETRWQAVDFHSVNLFNAYNRQLYIECLIILVIVSIILGVLYYRLHHEAQRRHVAEAQKEHFMRVVAHELRTPAAGVSGALSLITDSLSENLTADEKHLFEICERNTQQLLSLVDDFLDFHRMESGTFKLDKATVCVNEVVSFAIASCEAYATKFASKIVFLECDKEIASTIDSKRIQQVLINLFSNAAKYGAENDTIEVDLAQEADWVVIGVTDHGRGIPSDIQDTLFAPYVMSTSNKRVKISSTGLGLSIAKSIVEAHGGQIGFSSEENVGTRFYFNFPVGELSV